jgi:hypothetical protein
MSEGKDPPAEESDSFIFLSKMAQLLEDLEPLAKSNKDLSERLEEAKLICKSLATYQLQMALGEKLIKLANKGQMSPDPLIKLASKGQTSPDPPGGATPDPKEAEKQHQLNVEFLKGLALTARKSGDFLATRQDGTKLEMIMRIPKQ